MKTTNMNQLVHTNNVDWKQLIEEGVNTNGIFFKTLKFDEITQRPSSFLLKFEPGSSYPDHDHPAGEEIFVLKGEIRFGPDQLHEGDYLYTAPGNTHSAFSKTGCIALFVVPEEVEILK